MGPKNREDGLLRTRTSYDLVAQQFLERNQDRSIIREDLDEFASWLENDALILDIGCGPGHDAVEFQRRGFRVVCADLSKGVLQIGRARFPAPRVQADMRSLPFSRCAEGLWVNASLLHLAREQVPLALKEFHRVLLPGAVLHVSVKQGAGAGWDVRRYGAAAPRWFTYWLPAKFDELLEESGFEILCAKERPGELDDWLVRIARSSGPT
jgi:ubiquinone/menaquinone biosynthesis C-methylase UbiE